MDNGSFRKQLVSAIEAVFDATEGLKTAEKKETSAIDLLAKLGGGEFARHIQRVAGDTHIACVQCGVQSIEHEMYDSKCSECETADRVQ